MADIFLIPQMFSAQRFGVDTSKFLINSEIVENCMKIEEFKKAAPANQIDFE